MGKKLAIIIILGILLSLSLVEARITYQERHWVEEPCMECYQDITDYLDIAYNEITPTRWVFTVKPIDMDALLDKYSLSDLQNLKDTLLPTTDNLLISQALFNSVDKSLTFNVDFKDNFKSGERIKIGYKSVAYTSSTNLITVTGEDWVDNCWWRLYNASTVQGLGIGHYQNTNTYFFNSSIRFLSSNCSDYMSNVMIGNATWKAYLDIDGTSASPMNFTMGRKAGLYGQNGTSIIVCAGSLAAWDEVNITLYNTNYFDYCQKQMYFGSGAGRVNINFIYSTIHTGMMSIREEVSGDWNNSRIVDFGVVNLIDLRSKLISFNDFKKLNGRGVAAYYMTSGTVSMTGYSIYSPGTLIEAGFANTNDTVFNLIDSSFDYTKLTCSTGKSNGTINDQKTIAIKIVDEFGVGIEGVTVNISNRTGVNTLTTDSNGETSRIMTTVHWNYTPLTSAWSNWCLAANATYEIPFRFLIAKSGYLTLNFTFNVTEKTKLTINLLKTEEMITTTVPRIGIPSTEPFLLILIEKVTKMYICFKETIVGNSKILICDVD